MVILDVTQSLCSSPAHTALLLGLREGEGLVSACQQMRPLWLGLSSLTEKLSEEKVLPKSDLCVCIIISFPSVVTSPCTKANPEVIFYFAYLSFQATTFLTEHRSKDTPRIKVPAAIIMLICQTIRMKHSLLYLLIKKHRSMSFTTSVVL